MKRIFLMIMCATVCAAGCLAAAAAEEHMFIQSDKSIRIDEEYKEKFENANGFSVLEENDEQLIEMKGSSSIIGSDAAGDGFTDFVIEADIRQTACTGYSSGVFSIGMRSGGASSKQYRLAYISALNYNENTKKYGNGQIINDRLAIVNTSGSNACNSSSWYYAAVSDKPLGVLKGGATPWIHLRGVVTDAGIEFSAYDEAGNLISSLYSSMTDINMGIKGMPIIEKGGITLSSHSSDVYVKNIVVTPIREYGEIRVVPEYEKMYRGQRAPVRVTGDGEELCPEAYYSENIENGTVSFDDTGKKTVNVSFRDAATGVGYTRSCDIDVAEKIDFTSLEAELSSGGIVCGGSAECKTWAISPDGVRYNVDAEITGENITVRDNVITSDIPGRKVINIKYNDLKTTVILEVSRFLNIRLVPCRDKVTIWDKLYFHIEADDGMNVTELPADILDYSENAFSAEDGRLKANRTGKYKVRTEFDSVSVEAEIEVMPKEDGDVIWEDFESGTALSEYMQYDPEKVLSENGNNVYVIENEITDFFGDYEWQDYRIDFKLRIEKSVIEESQFANVFEIIPRRRIPEENMFGGDKGIPFVYRGGHNIDSPHMRISAAPGGNIDIEDGNWHNVSVEVSGCQMLFCIDDKSMCYSGSFPKKGYFSFRASNMSAYIDDVKVTLNKNKQPSSEAYIKRIENEKDNIVIPTHDAFSLSALTPVKAYYSDGSWKYLDIVNEVKWSILKGGDVVSISRNRGIKAKKAGTAVLCGSVGGKEFTLNITVEDDGMTDGEYAVKNLRKRRETYLYSRQKDYDEGVVKGIGGLGNLPVYYGEMLMYPRIRDYSEILDWHILQAEYEDTVVGRGNDGGDFVILQMINIYNKLKERINAGEESMEGMRKYLCGVRYPLPQDWMSENHKGVFYATAILVGETFPDDIMMDGMTGKELFERYAGYMKAWVNQRLKRGFSEYDSAHYYNVDIFTFENLYAVTKNPELKKMAEDMLTYLYADILGDSIEDVMTGAHSRVYGGLAYTTKFKMLEIMFDLSSVAFDELAPEKAVQDSHIFFGEYIPPDVIYDIAFEKDKRFVNMERRSIYAIPDDLLITDTVEKYTYTTPSYSMGCVVHVDDLEKYRSSSGNYQPVTSTYPASLRRNIIQGQQEIPWSLHFAGSSETMIYEGHAGPGGPGAATSAHGYFVGDLHCNCYQYFQEKNISIGMHKITRAGEAKLTHFWFPRDRFESIYEKDGWIFISHNGTYAAIKPLKDGLTEGTFYSWGSPEQKYNNTYPLDSVEVRVDSANTAFVCEVYEQSEYKGSFEDFCDDIINNTSVSYKITGDYYIEYTGLCGNTLKIDYNGNKRFLNGAPADTHEYKMQDSKYVSAEWDKGEIEILSDRNSYKIHPYLMEIDSRTGSSLLRKTYSFLKELESCSRTRRRTLIDAKGQEMIDLANTLSQYKYSDILNLCIKKMGEAAERLERLGEAELARQINKALAEIKATEE